MLVQDINMLVQDINMLVQDINMLVQDIKYGVTGQYMCCNMINNMFLQACLYMKSNLLLQNYLSCWHRTFNMLVQESSRVSKGHPMCFQRRVHMLVQDIEYFCTGLKKKVKNWWILQRGGVSKGRVCYQRGYTV